MCFDDPIYLDRGSFEDLMVDTDQHRICWMYHDILSHPRIAWLFDKYAGKGTPIREAWTTMAWVAAGYQEDSFYLLFKWYEDFRTSWNGESWPGARASPSASARTPAIFLATASLTPIRWDGFSSCWAETPDGSWSVLTGILAGAATGRSPGCVPPLRPISAVCRPFGRSFSAWWPATARRRREAATCAPMICWKS